MTDRITFGVEIIEQSRQYLKLVLAHTDQARWFEIPPGCPTHIGWQVGHLAMAQCYLGFEQVCAIEAPAELIERDYFNTHHGKGSVAEADASRYRTPEQLIETLDRVHTAVITAISKLDPLALEEPTPRPHPIARTRYEALTWIARHEMVHTGQIGLIRRLLGDGPYR